MEKQSYSNHRRGYHFYNKILLALIGVTMIGSFINLSESWGNESRIYSASLLVVVSFILLGGFYTYRNFGMVAQDRAIRAEENLRHFILTGKPLDNRLTLRQIIALRFASDDEFVSLANDAAEKKLSANEIKKAIKEWKGDYHRV